MAETRAPSFPLGWTYSIGSGMTCISIAFPVSVRSLSWFVFKHSGLSGAVHESCEFGMWVYPARWTK